MCSDGKVDFQWSKWRTSEQFIEMIIQKDNNCIIVTHGFFMHTLLSQIFWCCQSFLPRTSEWWMRWHPFFQQHKVGSHVLCGGRPQKAKFPLCLKIT